MKLSRLEFFKINNLVKFLTAKKSVLKFPRGKIFLAEIFWELKKSKLAQKTRRSFCDRFYFSLENFPNLNLNRRNFPFFKIMFLDQN